MYMVLIVDDEPIVCTLIEKLIEWERLGLCLAGKASDGLEALNIIREKEIDVVITDIRMPGMNGIELIHNARKEGYELSFILVSGYKEFEYAKSAIKYGVEEYLLKPINKTELNDLLHRIIIRKRKLNEKNQDEALIRAQLAKSHKTLREKWMLHLVDGSGEIASDTLEKVNEEYTFHFSPGCFCIIIGKIDTMNGENPDSHLCKTVYDKWVELLTRQILREITEFQFCVRDCFLYGIVNYSAGKFERKTLFREARNAFREAVFLQSGKQLVLAIGREFDDFSKRYEALQDAVWLIRQRVFGVTYPIFDGEQFPLRTNNISSVLTQKQRAQLIQIISSMEEEGIHTWLRETFPASVRYAGYLFDFINETVSTAFQCCEENEDLTTPKAFLSGYDDMATVAQIYDSLEQFLIEMVQRGVSDEKQTKSIPVNQAIQYIYDNYQRELSLNEVAGSVYMNASYFSMLFKKETGMNFSHFLTKVRIEHAKKMLKSSAMPVHEIARLVGYTDVRRFRRVFKEMTGVSPMEYRQIIHI